MIWSCILFTWSSKADIDSGEQKFLKALDGSRIRAPSHSWLSWWLASSESSGSMQTMLSGAVLEIISVNNASKIGKSSTFEPRISGGDSRRFFWNPRSWRETFCITLPSHRVKIYEKAEKSIFWRPIMAMTVDRFLRSGVHRAPFILLKSWTMQTLIERAFWRAWIIPSPFEISISAPFVSPNPGVSQIVMGELLWPPSLLR